MATNKGQLVKSRGCAPSPDPSEFAAAAMQTQTTARRRRTATADQLLPAAMASARAPLLRRLAPFHNGRIRADHCLLASSSPLFRSRRRRRDAVAGGAGGHHHDVGLRPCRLKELLNKEPSAEGRMLWLSVEAGGCPGFQYAFPLVNKKSPDDRDGAELVTDNVSYDFVKVSTVDYVEELTH
ncbi:hypothetical protein ACP70R_049511 [Stipagrostis hirtigluma subsp. patula]